MYPRPRDVLGVIDNLLHMRAEARRKGYALSSLMVIISRNAFYDLRNYTNNPDYIDRHKVFMMDYVIDSEAHGLYVEVVVKIGFANEQDDPRYEYEAYNPGWIV